MSKLDWDSFLQVVQDAPLVSIDLFLRNHDGEVLMGLRRNAPAENYWFVPGGRIEKDQTLELAFRDICEKEGIGSEVRLQDARFMGVYEHFYENDNAGGLPDVNTHYVALAFEVDGIAKSVTLSEQQHKESKWQDAAFVLSDPRVHPNVKRMFEGHAAYPTPGDRAVIFAQYQLVADRRNTTNALLWQSPVLSLTAQAFLFAIALNPSMGSLPRAIAAGLAFVVALASVQLLIKHRTFERLDAEWLHQFELRYRWRGLEPVSQKRKLSGIPEKWAASRIWVSVLLLFGAAALYVFVDVLM